MKLSCGPRMAFCLAWKLRAIFGWSRLNLQYILCTCVEGLDVTLMPGDRAPLNGKNEIDKAY
jgi:hypothetical protein